MVTGFYYHSLYFFLHISPNLIMPMADKNDTTAPKSAPIPTKIAIPLILFISCSFMVAIFSALLKFRLQSYYIFAKQEKFFAKIVSSPHRNPHL